METAAGHQLLQRLAVWNPLCCLKQIHRNSTFNHSPMQGTPSRFNGTLTKWNAERGFGFLVAEHGDQELFVHVSAFPRDGRPPTVGERLSFEMERDKEGRKRAVRVRRPGAPEPRSPTHPTHERVGRRSRRAPRHNESNRLGLALVTLLIVAGVGWYGYTRYIEGAEALRSAPQGLMSPAETGDPPITTAPAFQCDGRTHCSQMTSCSEAKQFLKNCPGMEMDGDGDGIPCEQQWCTGPLGE